VEGTMPIVKRRGQAIVSLSCLSAEFALDVAMPDEFSQIG
jgi:hypothetical protein